MSDQNGPRFDTGGYRIPGHRVTLGLGNSVKLYNWMQSKADIFAESRPHSAEIAKEASAALGFEVTEHNVQGIKRELGWTWHAVRRAGGGVERARKWRGQLKEAIERIEKLEARLTSLEVALGIGADPIPAQNRIQ